MKTLLQKILIYLGALFTTHLWFPGFALKGGIIEFLITAVVFILLNWFLKPVLKIIFLPLNLLTFGFFRWIINALVLFVLSAVVPYVDIYSFEFSGLSSQELTIPPARISYFFSLILAAFFIHLTVEFYMWLVED
jgi:putative membrane protein